MEAGLEDCNGEGGGVGWETKVIDWEETLTVVVAKTEEAPEDNSVATTEEDIL